MTAVTDYGPVTFLPEIIGRQVTIITRGGPVTGLATETDGHYVTIDDELFVSGHEVLSITVHVED